MERGFICFLIQQNLKLFQPLIWFISYTSYRTHTSIPDWSGHHINFTWHFPIDRVLFIQGYTDTIGLLLLHIPVLRPGHFPVQTWNIENEPQINSEMAKDNQCLQVRFILFSAYCEVTVASLKYFTAPTYFLPFMAKGLSHRLQILECFFSFYRSNLLLLFCPLISFKYLA